MSNKRVTIDDLATAVKAGFDGVVSSLPPGGKTEEKVSSRPLVRFKLTEGELVLYQHILIV